MNRRARCPRCSDELRFEDETQTFRCGACGWRNPMEELVTRRTNPFDY